jgi:hypothetical protein
MGRVTGAVGTCNLGVRSDGPVGATVEGLPSTDGEMRQTPKEATDENAIAVRKSYALQTSLSRNVV